jgi:hypothetical protein
MSRLDVYAEQTAELRADPHRAELSSTIDIDCELTVALAARR